MGWSELEWVAVGCNGFMWVAVGGDGGLRVGRRGLRFRGSPEELLCPEPPEALHLVQCFNIDPMRNSGLWILHLLPYIWC